MKVEIVELLDDETDRKEFRMRSSASLRKAKLRSVGRKPDQRRTLAVRRLRRPDPNTVPTDCEFTNIPMHSPKRRAHT